MFLVFMYLEKAYDRVDNNVLWKVMLLYGVGGKLMKAFQSFYVDSRPFIRIRKGE